MSYQYTDAYNRHPGRRSSQFDEVTTRSSPGPHRRPLSPLGVRRTSKASLLGPSRASFSSARTPSINESINSEDMPMLSSSPPPSSTPVGSDYVPDFRILNDNVKSLIRGRNNLKSVRNPRGKANIKDVARSQMASRVVYHMQEYILFHNAWPTNWVISCRAVWNDFLNGLDDGFRVEYDDDCLSHVCMPPYPEHCPDTDFFL